MFQGASNFSENVDSVFLFIFSISAFFLVGLTATMIWFTIRFNRKKNPKPKQIKDNMTLELTWTIIPLILVLAMFYYGYVVFKPMREVPEGAMNVKVTGFMWDWLFEYENGKQAKELYVPVNKPVKLNLYSTDVIHSFYVPAFRIKEDMVPGKPNYLWFIPTIEGTYEVLCAEYCGLRHSFMETRVVVISDTAFQRWINEKPDVESIPEGYTLLQNNACLSCHSMDGSALVGPGFKGLYNSEKIVLTGGKEEKITADSLYLIRSIYEPDADIVKGFNPGLMRSYKGVIKEEDAVKIIEYFRQTPKQ